MPQPVQLQLVGPRKSLSAVGTRVRLRVEGARVTPSRAVHVERLVAPRTRVGAGDGVGVADRVLAEDVDLVEAFIAQSTHVVLAGGMHLAVTRQRRVVHEAPVANLQIKATSQLKHCHKS